MVRNPDRLGRHGRGRPGAQGERTRSMIGHTDHGDKLVCALISNKDHRCEGDWKWAGNSGYFASRLRNVISLRAVKGYSRHKKYMSFDSLVAQLS
ncbi:MAG: hypothetical protein ABI809_10560 [Caldimonas sp.]